MKLKRFFLSAGAVGALALSLLAAACGGNASTTLSLSAGEGGSIATSTYSLSEGQNVLDFLKDKAPVPEEGLEFACWYEGDAPLSPERVMPKEGLSLTAKYYAEYTLVTHTEDGAGVYDEVTTTGKAIYLEPFSYTPPQDHFTLDDTKENVLSSEALQKHEVFSVWLQRNVYTVTLELDLPEGVSARPLAPVELPYESVCTLPVAEIDSFELAPYRFLGWAAEQDGNVLYHAGDTLTAEDDLTLHAVWLKGYADIFGGNDLLFPSPEEENVLLLEREELGEKKGVCNSDNTFSFSENGEEVLSGVLLDNLFYYFRDTMEKVYPDFDGTDDTMELKTHGAAVYTVQGVSKTGTYDIEENGHFHFRADSTDICFLLEEQDDELCFRLQGKEAGMYAPDDYMKLNGVVAYRLDGFGGGEELYSEDDPFIALDGSVHTSLRVEYFPVDEEDGVVSYRLRSWFEGTDYPINYFVFRITPSESSSVKGVLTTDDGLFGTFEDIAETHDTLQLNGFGKAKYGEKAGTYTVELKAWDLVGDEEYDNYVLTDLLVRLTVGDTDLLLRTRPFGNGNSYGYEVIDEDRLFGEYAMGSFTLWGYEIEDALLYVYQGYSSDLLEDNAAVLLGKTDGSDLYELIDYYSGYEPFEADENGVCTLLYGTKITLDTAKKTAALYEGSPSAGGEVVLLDGDEKLVIGEDGVARYTPAGGTVAQEVDYFAEDVYSDDDYDNAVYTVQIGRVLRTFLYRYDTDEYAYVTIEITEENFLISDGELPIAILIYGEKGAKKQVYIGVPLTNYAFYYAFRGTVEEGETCFTFTCDKKDYDETAEPDFSDGFDYILEDGVPVLRISGTYDELTCKGDTLSLDGFGNAVLVSAGERTNYVYEVAFSYVDEYVGEINALYVMAESEDDENVLFFTVDEDTDTFAISDNDFVMYLENAFTSDAYILDGCGTAYAVTYSGTVPEETVTPVKYSHRGDGLRHEFDFYFDDDNDGVPDEGVISVLVITNITDLVGFRYALFIQKDEAQEGTFAVKGGGSLEGTGYGLCEDGSIVDWAYYIDADGVAYQGVLEIGTLEDDKYNTRLFNKTAEGDVIRFTAMQDGGGYAIEEGTFIFDIDSSGNAVLRTEYFGAYRLFEQGKPTSASLYLDGHGNAELFDKKEQPCGEGKVSYDETLDAYRYIDNEDEEQVFLFNLYSRAEGDGTAYFYSVYTESEKTDIVGKDWSVLRLDGFVGGVYVSRYGDVVRGAYGFLTDWLVVLYPNDGSRRIYFELKDNSFEVPAPEDGFLVRDHILYAYTLDLIEGASLTLPDDVVEIYNGVFEDMPNLESIDLNNVEVIGDYAFAFSGSYYLNSDDVALLKTVTSTKVRSIGYRAFAGLTYMEEANFPLATVVGAEAFYDSRVTSVVLGNVTEVGNRAFAHNATVDTMKLDLSAVTDVTAVAWGSDLFAVVDGGEITNAVTSVRILLKDIAGVNSLYGHPSFTAVKESLGVKSDVEELYYALGENKTYLLMGGVFSDTKAATLGTLIPDKAYGIAMVEGQNVTLHAPKADGTGYEGTGTKLGTLDVLSFQGSVLIATGRELTLSAGSQTVGLTFGYTFHYSESIEVAVTIDGEETTATFDKTDGIRCTAQDGTAYTLTVNNDGTATLTSLGGEFTVETEYDDTQDNRQFSVTFMRGDSGLTVIGFQINIHYSWLGEDEWKDTFIKAETVNDTTFLVYSGDTKPEDADRKNDYMYTVYQVVYDGSAVTVTEFGRVVEADAEDDCVLFAVDNENHVLGIVFFTNLYNNYTKILSVEETESGVYTVKAEHPSSGNEKTFIITLGEDFASGNYTCTIEMV